MNRIVKWLLWAIAALCIAGLVLGLFLYMVLQRSVPDQNGTAQLDGLTGNVRVVMDKEGIPHIEAESHLEASRVLGYLHARERLWQMEVLRMAGQGRLSEMFGDATISSDTFLRTLNMAHYARASYETLRPETKAVLTAYVEGVNSYMNRDLRLMESALPPEFLILGHEPEPWKAWQPGLVIKVMALTLGSNLTEEIQRLALSSKGYTPRQIDDLVPYSPRDTPPPLPDIQLLYGVKPSAQQSSLLPVKNASKRLAPKEFEWPVGRTASNNWVISGSRTESGAPILANDPHLGLTAPATFYLAHVSFEHSGVRHNVIGGSLPGTPFILVGRNDHVAWGLTTTNLDAQDLYVEKLNPKNPDQYRTDVGWSSFEMREETITVSGGKPVALQVRTSRHGPVLPDSYRGLKTYLPAGHVAALKWAALTEDDVTPDGAVAIMTASSVSSFVGAARSIISPMQSMVLADTQGNIGLVAPGRIPLRDESNQVMGRAPVPGWLPQYEWKGYVPYLANPRFVNPAQGALATANANFLPETYNRHITFDWAEQFRQERVEGLVIGANEKHTIAKSHEIIADTYSPAMVRLRDIAFRIMPDHTGANDAIIQALRAWDGRMEADRAEPLIMLSWFRNLHQLMLKDDLGTAFSLFERGRITPLLRIIETSGARDWCDNIQTAVEENCGDIVRQALEMSLAELQGAHGKDWRRWNYGEAHVAYGEHRPFAKVGPLAGLFNIVLPSGGGPYTLFRGQTDFSEEGPYRNRHASVYRAIYDLSDLDKSVFIQFGGQSGHFMSRFYRNFAERWSKAEFISMSTKPADYEAGHSGIWQFEPAKGD